MKCLGLGLATSLVILGAAVPAAARVDHGYRVVWDDFSTPWSVGAPASRWLQFTAGTYSADDAYATSSPHGLEVRSRGHNALTGEPAFVNTLDQGAGWLSPFDHAKWIVIMNHLSSAGVPGFDAVPGQELGCAATVSGRVYGGARHPFGRAVDDPDTDPRLGAVAISAFDPVSFVIFNFLLTNEMVYAFYERPVFARTAADDYASFSYAIPVLWRRPSDHHRLKIAYDKAGGAVRWLVDGAEVFRVGGIGSRIDRRYMLVDHGGEDRVVSPDQLDCGMAMFDFLDGVGPTRRGLVQIEADSGDYYDPHLGDPMGLTFVDPHSSPHSRLFGQGASMTVKRFVVSSRPVSERDDDDDDDDCDD